MEREDIIKMSIEELRRVSVLKQAMDRLITQRKAAEIIGLSYRQTKRLVSRVREEGEKGIIHRLRGRPGNRRIDDNLKVKTIRLYERRYWDFGPTFASEKLDETDDIKVDHETLRRWLIGANNSKRNWQRKSRPHRRWRERKHHFGEMVQMDGSHHDWLEGRGPELVLMGYIDDATSKVFARFYDYEGIMPAMDSFKRYMKKYGIPQMLYLDNYSPYKARRKPTIEEQLMNEDPLTQFERAAKELGVRVNHANSPQAKGRIERSFRTFQDRLVKELRLAGIKNKEEANKFLETYLPRHNKRFSVPAMKKANLHRKAPAAEELKKILCIKTRRSLRRDGVIRHNNGFYQVEDIPRRKIRSVMVEDWLDGSMHVRNNGSYLKYVKINPVLTAKPTAEKRTIARKRKPYIPPKDHPWRRFKQRTYNHEQLQPISN